MHHCCQKNIVAAWPFEKLCRSLLMIPNMYVYCVVREYILSLEKVHDWNFDVMLVNRSHFYDRIGLIVPVWSVFVIRNALFDIGFGWLILHWIHPGKNHGCLCKKSKLLFFIGLNASQWCSWSWYDTALFGSTFFVVFFQRFWCNYNIEFYQFKIIKQDIISIDYMKSIYELIGVSQNQFRYSSN